MLEVDIVNSINSYLECNGIRYSNELRMGIGIPDISLNIGANCRLKPIDNYFLLSILKFIDKKRVVSFDDIKKEFLLTMGRVKQYVFTLADMSFVKIKKQLVKVIKHIFSTKLGTTISIEAKLKDWKGACLQAQRYLCFSDYAYVAMPNAYIRNVDTNIFEQSGIGLLSVFGKKIDEIIPAKRSDSCEFTQKYLITSKIVEKYIFTEKKHLRKTIFTACTLLET
jgi:hypothetical protein